MSELSVQQIFNNLDDTLRQIEFALEQVSLKDPRRRAAGVRNVVVYGRSVTFVLQNLRGKTNPDFDEWYKRKQEVMKQDPFLKSFVELRNLIEKRGQLLSSGSAQLHRFDPSLMAEVRKTKPANAVGFFIGDRLGGSGWEIKSPDGTESVVYIDLPDNVFSGDILLQVDTSSHLGNPISDVSSVNICRTYYSFLVSLVGEAKRTFCSR